MRSAPAAVGEVEAVAVVERDVLEELRALAPLHEVGKVDADHFEVPSRRGLVDVDQSVRLGEREGTQEEAVDEAKDDDVGGDPERQHDHDERGREFLPRERSQRVLEICPQHEQTPFVDGLRQARVTASQRARDRRAQQVPDGGAPGARGGRSAAHAGVGERVDEEVGHFLGVAAAQGARAEPQEHSIDLPGPGRRRRHVIRGHEVSPARGFTRARAMRTRPARRWVSAAAAARPARVIR